MAEVYLAEQVSLGRQVALKVLKRDLSAQPAMAERFRREAKLLSTVDHPSVVRVIDFETNKRDGTVLVLELAEGQTLENALQAGPFDPKRAVPILLQLAQGLAAVHERGIIHRDLKPQNIVIGPGPRGEQARLLDFGIARLMELGTDSGPAKPDLSPNTDPFMSLPGQAVGTPAYVAPEQAMANPVDTRTDVYAFGVVAYRVLAGRLPFLGPGARDYLEQHVHELPPPLEAVAPHVAPYPLLAKLVMSCLAKKADRRPRDGAALVEALGGALPTEQATLSAQTRQVLNAMTTQTLTAVKDRAQSLGAHSLRSLKTAGRALGRLDRQFKQSLLVTLGLTLAILFAWTQWPPSLVERAEAELGRGDPEKALATIEGGLADSKGLYPALLSLKAAALHELGREEEARALVRQWPYQTLFPGRPGMVKLLCEGFSDSESDQEIVEWLALLPWSQVAQQLEGMAQEVPSQRQWGALRYLDSAGKAQALNLPQRYVAALKMADCRVRAVASVRLGELGDISAIPALRELSETPKDGTQIDPKNCGQDEAAEAIRELKRPR